MGTIPTIVGRFTTYDGISPTFYCQELILTRSQLSVEIFTLRRPTAISLLRISSWAAESAEHPDPPRPRRLPLPPPDADGAGACGRWAPPGCWRLPGTRLRGRARRTRGTAWPCLSATWPPGPYR